MTDDRFSPPPSPLPQGAGERGGQETAELIRVRGLVQGVGFRPTVWRLARQHGLRGWVGNDGEGVTACICGPPAAVAAFAHDLLADAPPLARIDRVEREPAAPLPPGEGFRIVPSRLGAVHTGVVPDAATCRECRGEIFDPAVRRFRHAFANCTHCGPRLSIIEAIPYDRATTTMRAFDLCEECAAEYADPADRRFHAQPIACPRCGPQVSLADGAGRPVGKIGPDAVAATCRLLLRGRIVAVKGLGGFQLACDATDERAVGRLRRAKRRECKPFALMASELDVVRRYCTVGADEAAALQSPAAPIVIMQAGAGGAVAAGVAPGVPTLGFMLPNTPLHHLLLHALDRPIVLTSGNVSDEPQCIGNDEAVTRLAGIAEYFLLHDRDITRRVDDSVVRRVAGRIRVVRRARGYAPAPLRMPPGFSAASPVLAMGGELKNTFCLLRDGEAILSHHMGDLGNAPTFADYTRSIEQYLALFEHRPEAVAIDLHPEYLSSKLGIDTARQRAVRLVEVQHHHAHVAACMAENGISVDAGPVIGVALDGLGFGADGTLWGGAVLLADYRGFRRLARLKPVAMPGGTQAICEPWRNAYAHIVAAIGWPRFAAEHGATALGRFLAAKPRTTLDGMIARNVNSPLASSCGRLFDAVAAAVGICRERAQYEGQAAVELEAMVDRDALQDDGEHPGYKFDLVRLQSSVPNPKFSTSLRGAERRSNPGTALDCFAALATTVESGAAELPVHDTSELIEIDPRPMWLALLDDVAAGVLAPVIAARFHKGLAIAVAGTVAALRGGDPALAATSRVALSGGVFQNSILLEQVSLRLASQGLDVLMHRDVPANDGGLSLGQAAIAAARARAC